MRNQLNIFKMSLKFQNLSSAIDIGFWQSFANLKLEELKLSDSAVPITATYSVSAHKEIPARLNFTTDSLSGTSSSGGQITVTLSGQVINFNTFDAFKSNNALARLKERGLEMWNKNEVNTFILFSYADLKTHIFYYWFAFPTINFPALECSGIFPIAEKVNVPEFSTQLQTYLESCADFSGFFSVNGDTWECSDVADTEFYGYLDPSPDPKHPGAPLRNFLARLSQSRSGQVSIIAIKDVISANNVNLVNSVVFTVTLPEVPMEPDIVGLEPNAKGKLGPRIADLRPHMDPRMLAESSVSLNLKLMRWRLLPEIDLETVKNTKCLLVGSGTLGCQVARNLLAWGVEKITFIDNGVVSYSNPVRQSLFTFEDSVKKRPKAQAAADALKQIYPSVQSEGHTLEIPMPGHATTLEQSGPAIETLTSLVTSHDVIYLLTDTRESRWLPAVLAAVHDKICITVGLGFDSFVVMRHGGRTAPIGCYFCNDVVGPRNSTRDRTLDQQCTVTRPGLSFQSSSIGVELLISILHHPLKHYASFEEETILGALPQQVRGSFSTFSTQSLSGQRFDRCPGCSPRIIDAYEMGGAEFLLRVFNEPSYLEDVSGLTELSEQVADMDIIEWDSDEN